MVFSHPPIGTIGLTQGKFFPITSTDQWKIDTLIIRLYKNLSPVTSAAQMGFSSLKGDCLCSTEFSAKVLQKQSSESQKFPSVWLLVIVSFLAYHFLKIKCDVIYSARVILHQGDVRWDFLALVKKDENSLLYARKSDINLWTDKAILLIHINKIQYIFNENISVYYKAIH